MSPDFERECILLLQCQGDPLLLLSGNWSKHMANDPCDALMTQAESCGLAAAAVLGMNGG